MLAAFRYLALLTRSICAPIKIISIHIPKSQVNNNIGDVMFIPIIRAAVLYIIIIVAVRLMGKRQISDLQTTELVVTMLISDIASVAVENTSQPLLSGVVPMLIPVVFEIILSAAMIKTPHCAE